MERKRFVETYKITAGNFRKQNVSESTLAMIESADGKSYKAKAVYTFPISRPDKENLNGRIYTSKLWEKVIKEKQAEGCFGLMDHPEDDGSTRNAWCVWRNLRFSDDRKLVVADAYLFGFWGQQVLEALEAGGSVGLSTSGFGEFKDDDKTLNEETYSLERVADFVLNPSYEVFGHQEDLRTDEPKKESVAEATIPRGRRIDFDDDLVKVYKDNQEIYSGLEDFEPMKNAPWKWDNGKGWYTYQDMIKVCVENLENSPKSDKEIVMENNKTTVSPSIEEKSLLLNIKSMFKESRQIPDVFERLDSYASLLSYFNEGMSELSTGMKAEIEKAVEEDNALIRQQVGSYSELNEKASAFESKAADLEKQLAEANEKLATAEASLKEAEDKLAVVTNENAELEKKFSESCDMLDSFKTYATKQKDIVRTLEAEKNGMVSPKEYKEAMIYSQSLEEELKKVKTELFEAKKACKKEDDGEEGGEDSQDAGDNDAAGGDDDDKEDDDDLEKMNDKKKKKESFTNEDIELYYNDLVYRNPKVALIKSDILKCRTVLEAQMTYLRLKGLVEEDHVGYSDRAIKAQTRQATVEEKQVRHTALREGWV